MKTLFIAVIMAITAFWQKDHYSQVTLTDQIPVTGANTSLVIDNLFGNIEILTGEVNEIRYEVVKTIDAGSSDQLIKAKEEVQLRVLERNDSVILYLDAPYICNKWNGCDQSKRNINHGPDYDFTLDCKVFVPIGSNVDVQTVDKGNVSVKGVAGRLKANNVNGNVTVEDAVDLQEAKTVNGDVTIHYKNVPQKDCQFFTINGIISITSDQYLNAEISAKTMNGQLYSEFDYEIKKPELVKETIQDGDKTTYKIEEKFGIVIGSDGPKLSFETLNGDIYLRKL